VLYVKTIVATKSMKTFLLPSFVIDKLIFKRRLIHCFANSELKYWRDCLILCFVVTQIRQEKIERYSHLVRDQLASFFAFTFDDRNDFTSDPPAKRQREAMKQIYRSDTSKDFVRKAERSKTSHFDEKRLKALKKYLAV